MKKRALNLILTIGLTFLLVSCNLMSGTRHLSTQKDDIVAKKYGEVEYIVKGILIYKNLSEEFESIKGVDYIIENSGDRGSVIPFVKENYYLSMDIVKHDDEYKLLLYNVITKMYSNKRRMFVMVDYFLPLDINNIISFYEKEGIEQKISRFHFALEKKGKELNEGFDDNEPITKRLYYAYQNKISEGTFYMTLFDYQNGNIVVGTSYDYFIANEYKKEIYYPKYCSYENIVGDVYNTLNDEKISFSLNAGLDFQLETSDPEEYEIWNEQINDEVWAKIFFQANTYEDFNAEVDEMRNSNLFEDYYIVDKDFEQSVSNYDQTFFEDNILLLYYKFEANISQNYVHSVTIKDDTLTLNVNRFEGMETAISSWLELVTIKKADIENVTKFDLIVRTIYPLVESVYIYIDVPYAKEFYVNSNILNKFENLNNVSNIEIFNWSLNVDLHFGVEVNEEDLLSVIDYLENNSNVKSTGYKGKDFIRVQMNFEFYDKVFDKTITVKDLIEDQQLIDQYEFTTSVLDFIPFVTLTFVLENKGREQASILIRDLIKENFPFVNREYIYLNIQ